MTSWDLQNPPSPHKLAVNTTRKVVNRFNVYINTQTVKTVRPLIASSNPQAKARAEKLDLQESPKRIGHTIGIEIDHVTLT